MNAIIAAVNDEIKHLKKSIESNDYQIYDLVNANATMKGRINQLQYELDKLKISLSQNNVGMAADCNAGTDKNMKCVSPIPNIDRNY